MQPANEVTRIARVFAWLAILLGAAVLGLYVFASVIVFRLGPQSREPGWTAVRAHSNWYVRTVDADGPAAAKLQPNDRILAINGDVLFSQTDPALKLQYLASGQPYSIQIMRGGTQDEVRLDLPQRRDFSNVAWLLSLLIAGLAFYIVGVALGLLRPGSSVTRVGCIAALVTAVHIGGLILRPIAPLLAGRQQLVYALAGSVAPWHLAFGYLFFSSFPSPVRENRVWKATTIFICSYCALLFMPRTILNFVAAQGEEPAINYHLNHAGWIGLYQANTFALGSAFKFLVAAAAFLVLWRNYRLLAHMPDQRRRVKWVMLAAAVGILLPGLFTLVIVATGNTSLPRSGAYPINIIVTNLFSAVIPITLAYAVIKHRVLGVNVVIRLGIQYLFARNSLRLLLLLPVLSIAWSIAAHPNRTVAQFVTESSVYSYGFLVLSAGLSLRYRQLLTGWVDRKFFREAYDQEMILLDMIERLKLAESVSEILTMVGTQVSAALHPASLHVCCRQAGVEISDPSYFSFGDSGEITIGDKVKLLEIASTSRSTMEFIPGRSSLPDDAAGLLEQLGARLVVPVNDSQHRPIGMMLLGEKRSEEPYTPSNLNLLKAIAAETGVALELVWLRERVDNEQKMKDNALALLEHKRLNLVHECPQCGACFDHAADRCSSDGSPLASPLLVERVIDGKYRLDQRIGKGGYGAVYEARDLGLKRSVAVKVVTGGLLAHKSAMRRFGREAQAAARLNHPNIIAIHDYGLARPGGAYLAMELIRGSTWRSELRGLGVIAPPLAAEWLDQLFEGVASAHQEGVIHRDLKPENVLIASTGSGPGLIKILDFGLAKMRLLDLNDPDNLTLAGTVVGTLGYMSPEQFTGGEVDERSDIFSLGIMTVEALTGRRPFRGRTQGELLKSLLNDPMPFRAKGPEGKELNRVLRRCLAREVENRYRSVSEMRRDLIPLLRNCRSLAIQPNNQEHMRTMTMPG